MVPVQYNENFVNENNFLQNVSVHNLCHRQCVWFDPIYIFYVCVYIDPDGIFNFVDNTHNTQKRKNKKTWKWLYRVYLSKIQNTKKKIGTKNYIYDALKQKNKINLLSSTCIIRMVSLLRAILLFCSSSKNIIYGVSFIFTPHTLFKRVNYLKFNIDPCCSCLSIPLQ